jgi:dTDP-4-dehydrorhamnose reductase
MSGEKKTIVIFGISSFVGSNLAECLKDRYRIIGTYLNNKVTIPGVVTIPCDVLKKDQVQTIIYTFRPDLTIYAVGLSSLMDCYEYPKLADALNAVGVFNTSQFSERYNSKFCYLSSGFIFSGHKGEVREHDTPLPNTVYGRTVASSEFYVQKSCLNYLVFRCCKLYGRNYNINQLNFLERLERGFEEGKAIECDGTVNVGWLEVSYLAEAIHLSFEAGVRNRLVQVSSRNIMTAYEFAKLYAKIFKQPDTLLTKTDWDFPIENLKYDITRDDDKFYYQLSTFNIEATLGLKIPTVEESLIAIKDKWQPKSGRNRKVKKGSGVSFI